MEYDKKIMATTEAAKVGETDLSQASMDSAKEEVSLETIVLQVRPLDAEYLRRATKEGEFEDMSSMFEQLLYNFKLYCPHHLDLKKLKPRDSSEWDELVKGIFDNIPEFTKEEIAEWQMKRYGRVFDY
jgi:hypothetical protein